MSLAVGDVEIDAEAALRIERRGYATAGGGTREKTAWTGSCLKPGVRGTGSARACHRNIRGRTVGIVRNDVAVGSIDTWPVALSRCIELDKARRRDNIRDVDVDTGGRRRIV